MRFRTAAVALGLALAGIGGTTAVLVNGDDSGTDIVAAGPGEPAAEPAAIAEPSVIAAPIDVPPVRPTVAPTKAPPPVKKLSKLATPDVLVTTKTPLTAAQVAKLKDITALENLAVFRTAAVTVQGKRTQAIGVDPSQFRAFTPQETAQSDELWKVVAKGELTASYALGRTNPLPLGGDVAIAGKTKRLGARASLGLPGVDLITDTATLASLGVNGGGALVEASDRGIQSLQRSIKKAVGADATLTVLRAKVLAPISSRPSSYRDLYIRSAGYCPGLSWTVLAAIGQVESGHGRNNGPSSAGALGPMQFLPSTWAAYGVDGDGDGQADINSPFDAVPGAAVYLCRNGAGRGGDDLYNAIFAYNHADWYVRKVLGLAAQYK